MKSKATVKPLKESELFTLRTLIFFGFISVVNFFYGFFNPTLIEHKALFWLLALAVIYANTKMLVMWYNYWSITVPKPAKNYKKPTVDVLTTYFPGEPYEMVLKTLEAIQKMNYPHTTYLCDEANDPYLIEKCKEMGVIHVTRDNRVNAKAGNINNALKRANGEICLILDPDHIPYEDFLEQVVPYFNDPKVGFVQVVQSYYNIDESLVARGAAEQTFQFYGPMMMCMNAYGTVNAIGANCTFRRSALDSIGGHAPGLSEDMHTAMKLHAAGWESIYVPRVVAKGLSPSTLPAYYKQQLKWSRGTFELLLSEYPKLFKNFSWRQKLHYGFIPMHYLSGLFYLINFLIPIISLFLAVTPWKGNILNFGFIILPVLASSFFIRAYVQEWLIEKKERGFHVVGGILQINTWWVFLLGFVYTLIRKKIPYLPTPKDGSDKTSWKLLVPNIGIGVLSLTAIVYGLQKDFTPFSIFMSGFALINAFFMFLVVYFARESYREVPKAHSITGKAISAGNTLKSFSRLLRNWLLPKTRKYGLVSAIFILFLSLYAQSYTNFYLWDGVKSQVIAKAEFNYMGIFYPSKNDGLSNIDSIKLLEDKINSDFNIISLYVPWGEQTVENAELPLGLIDSIYSKKAVPMITWEPWASTFTKLAVSNVDLANEKKVFQYIAQGYFDSYILNVAIRLKSYNRPVFLRFAHEFDNPQYPWSPSGNNTPEDFKAAWKHVHALFESAHAHNIVWVWNPLKAESMQPYFPGEEYVDWIGVTSLNYGIESPDKTWYSFSQLYNPLHRELKKLPELPVMITEFGSLRANGNQKKWMHEAFTDIKSIYKEVKGIVFFNSSFDKNFIQKNGASANSYLDWKIEEHKALKNISSYKTPPSFIAAPLAKLKENTKTSKSNISALQQIKGVNFKKGQNWYNDYYVLTRTNLVDDFIKIKNLGINTVKYHGPNVYDHNVLNIAKETGVQVTYAFWIPKDTDFIEDSLVLKQIKKDILKTIAKHKNKSQIISWNISNDLLSALDYVYNKPTLIHQQLAYVTWLQKLVLDIKTLDPNRPIVVNININQQSITHVDFLRKHIPEIDAFGLVVHDKEHLKSFLLHTKKHPINYIFNDILAKDIDHELLKKPVGVFIRNWQDQFESDKVSFDGLLNRYGNRNPAYFKVDSLFNQAKNATATLPQIKILKPSITAWSGRKLLYYTVILEDGNWVFPENKYESLEFSWALVKCDAFGNPIAIKNLGASTFMEVSIPKAYENYLLMVTATRKTDKATVSTFTKLNTPLYNYEGQEN